MPSLSKVGSQILNVYIYANDNVKFLLDNILTESSQNSSALINIEPNYLENHS